MLNGTAALAEATPSAAKRFPKLAALIGYLDSLNARADLSVLERLLGSLDLRREDFAEACVFGTRGYRRNRVAVSAWYELLALCWRSGDVTAIHDHRGSSCAFRVIEGTGTEIRFRRTESGLVCPVSIAEMQPGYLCAAADDDIHQVLNLQAPGVDLITLHIYSPPILRMHTYAPPKPREFEPLERCEEGHEGCL